MARARKRKVDTIEAHVDDIEAKPVVPVLIIPDAAAGVECPNCGCRDFRHSHVISTRCPVAGILRRRRECRHCGRRLTTTERAEATPGLRGFK
jgi:DNA-directed RNA polymerase subunit RPC12/RpoP